MREFGKSKGKDGAHIDVENPNPNNRKGSIHYQEGKNKYIYNTKPNNLMEHIEVLTNGYSQIKVCNKLFVMD